MIGVIKRRADQIIHRGVHDDKILPARAFHIFDARDENARVADDKPARLDEQTALKAAEGALNGCCVLSNLGCGIEFARVIVDSQSATRINGLEGNAFALQLS